MFRFRERTESKTVNLPKPESASVEEVTAPPAFSNLSQAFREPRVAQRDCLEGKMAAGPFDFGKVGAGRAPDDVSTIRIACAPIGRCKM
jgi:hypothetical protein